MSYLPEGWTTASLSDLAVYAIGGDWGTDNAHEIQNGVRVAVMRSTEYRDWDRNRAQTAATRYVKRSSLETRRLEAGDLVVEVSGGGPTQPVGRVALIDCKTLSSVNDPLICSNFCRKLRLQGLVDSGFVALALKRLYWTGGLETIQTHTTNLRNLDFKQFLALELPLPPLREQKRIVAKVEELLAQVSSACERLEKVPAILKRLRQSVLAAACSGRLTEDWRKSGAGLTSPESFRATLSDARRQVVGSTGRRRRAAQADHARFEVPEGWLSTSFDEVTTLITSGSRGWAKYYSDTGAVFIRAQDINTDRLILEEIAHVAPPKGAEGARTRVRRDDLLVTITGANVTKSALVNVTLEEAYVSQHVALARPVVSELSRWLHLWTVSPAHGRAYLLEAAYGAGKPGLNLDNLREMPVILPLIEEQKEIGRRVDALFGVAETIEAHLGQGMYRAAKVAQATLSKAFRGDLVPTEAELARVEDRDYETASQLLERIRAEGQAQRPTKVGRRKKPNALAHASKKPRRRTATG